MDDGDFNLSFVELLRISNSATFPQRNLQNLMTERFSPFQSSVTFLYPLKTSENQRFSDVFRGYRNVTQDQNGLKLNLEMFQKNVFEIVGKNTVCEISPNLTVVCNIYM